MWRFVGSQFSDVEKAYYATFSVIACDRNRKKVIAIKMLFQPVGQGKNQEICERNRLAYIYGFHMNRRL